MGLRADLLDLLACDEDAVRGRLQDLITDGGLEPEHLPRTRPESTPLTEPDDLTERGESLVSRVRLLDDAPLGITLSGPAYRDTPVLYANRTVRDLTGYSLDELRGHNPRLLQGPRTDPDAVADLHEAISIWEPVTVDVWNHRRDGQPFLNRVSLRPLSGDDGTVTHWAAVQEAIETPDDER